jgi:TDG/mug DNA glycosylase family protein
MNCSGFRPIAGADAHTLILGTLPGGESLRRCEYYAKSSNSFWRIMGTLVGAEPGLPYQQRLTVLLKKRIAVWDVCSSADRAGSLDSKIVNSTVVANDFATFLIDHPGICLICFNGRTAEKIFRRKASLNTAAVRLEALPSTSPAYAAMTFTQKLDRWREVLALARRD